MINLRKLYQLLAFYPGILGVFINPFYFARKGLAKNIGELAGKITGKTLDIGCGSKPYADLYKSTEYIGLEIDSPEARAKRGGADHFYDGETFPFPDETFDSVVTNQVFEHVFNPEVFLKEVHRILKPEGTMLMTVPFVWDEHEQPWDFARYSSFGIRAILEKNGFLIVEQRKSIDDIRVIFQLLNAYIYKKTVTKNEWINLFITLALNAPVNIIGELCNVIFPRNSDLYLDNILLVNKN